MTADVGPVPVHLDTATLDTATLGDGLVPGEWVERALCGHRDPELFYPVGSAGPALRQVAEAKAVCARCPVVDDCLEWALDVGEAHGVWGGTTPEERRFLRRGRGLAHPAGECPPQAPNYRPSGCADSRAAPLPSPSLSPDLYA